MTAKGRDTKPHVGIFGRRNVGKSSLINALVGQDIAIVSDVAGTTTDPVKKSIEVHGLGPLIFIDTAGIDDTGDLGELRIKKSMAALKLIDLAILVISENRFEEHEVRLTEELDKLDVPYVIVHNKSDLTPVSQKPHRQGCCGILCAPSRKIQPCPAEDAKGGHATHSPEKPRADRRPGESW